MTKTELHAILGGLWPGLMKAIAQAMHDETAKLHERIAALEQRRSMSYRGVHQRSEAYARGDVVTRKGVLWHACKDTIAIPGESSDWMLMEKS